MFKKQTFIQVLGFWGDKKPHRLFEQFVWLKHINRNLRDTDFLNINRLLFNAGLIKGVGNNYFKFPLVKRTFVLTNKGDDAIRSLAIEQGGDYSYYKNFERRTAK